MRRFPPCQSAVLAAAASAALHLALRCTVGAQAALPRPEIIPLVNPSSPAKILIPSAANGGSTLGTSWTTLADPPNIGLWTNGFAAIGYDNSPSPVDYAPHFLTSVAAMQNTNPSVFVRVKFTVPDAAALGRMRHLLLRLKYEDGFAAWLNGTPVAGANNPSGSAWDAATPNNATREDTQAIVPVGFDLTPFRAALVPGENVLAIQAFNADKVSSDLLLSPQLVAMDWPALHFRQIGVGFRQPVAVTHAGDGSGRLFVVEKAGVIKIIRNAAVAGVFLDIRGNVSASGEQGLLGLAFPPGYSQKGWFYATYNRASDSAAVLSRFFLDPAAPDPANQASPASEQILLTWPKTVLSTTVQTNHNGGDIHFGPDGFLYWGTGDGGGGGDPQNRSQNPSDLAGKMLRLDVESPPIAAGAYGIPPQNPFVATAGARPEIWALGLRNPWRWSFDRLTGDMWLADVGQSLWEEVNVVPSGAGGRNFEWRRREGMHPYSSTTSLTIGATTPPVIDIGHSPEASITGGCVYRGQRFPHLHGIYLFGDYVSKRLWAAQRISGSASGEVAALPVAATNWSISAFGEDEQGNILLVDLAGTLQEIRANRDSQYLEITRVEKLPGTDRLRVTIGAGVGESYQVLESRDLQNWTPLGAPLTAAEWNDFRVTYEDPAPPVQAGPRFLRVFRTSP